MAALIIQYSSPQISDYTLIHSSCLVTINVVTNLICGAKVSPYLSGNDQPARCYLIVLNVADSFFLEPWCRLHVSKFITIIKLLKLM